MNSQIRVALVRGAYLNNYEGQNYANFIQPVSITAFSSLQPLHNSFVMKVVRLPSLSDVHMPRWLANRTLGDRQILFGLENRVRSFDIVHTADPHYYYSYQLAKLRQRGQVKMLISTSWETIPFNNESTRAKQMIKQFSMQHIDRYVCHTERARDSLVREGVSNRLISVIPLGVDLDQFYPAHQRRSTAVRILFAGRNVYEKGTELVRLIAKAIPNSEIVTAQNIPYAQMPDLYRTVDVVIMPSLSTPTWEEQYGMVLLEAMASGLPIVAYRSGAIPEVLGTSGVLVEEGNNKRFMDEITDLVKNPTRRAMLSRLARKRAEARYDRRQFQERLYLVYRKTRYTS